MFSDAVVRILSNAWPMLTGLAVIYLLICLFLRDSKEKNQKN